MNLKSLISGTDIRGRTDGPDAVLTPNAVRRLAFAFAKSVSEKVKKPVDEVTIALGMDSRSSGPPLTRAAGDGLCRAGANVLEYGMCTTPAMYMSILTPGFEPDGAIMLTASHHPGDMNGMKFFIREGGLDADDIAALAAEAGSMVSPENFSFAGSIVEKPFLPVYKESLAKLIHEGMETDVSKPLLGLHVIVDAGNGVGGFFAELLSELGAWTEGSQFLEPDGRFPNHIPNPENSVAMASICDAVARNGADLGVIFDADCDRVAIVDQLARPINRNRLIALVSAVLLNKQPGVTIVTDSVTSSGLTRFIGEWGGVHYRYKRGYRNVINEAILLNNEGIDCPLAIETSGHAAFRSNYFLDDGMYLATMLIIEAMRMKQDGKVLSSLLADLEEPVESIEVRLKITNDDFRQTGRDVIAKVLDYASAVESWHIAPDNREGVRINFHNAGGYQNGWFLLRLSVHDPVLPLNAESDIPGGIKLMLTDLLHVLSGCNGIDVSLLADTVRKL